MKGKTKLITAAAVVVIAAFIGVRLFSGGEKAVDYETRPTVDLQKPQKGDIVLYTDMTGTIQPLSRASVMPKMAGEVLEVYFKAGDQVEAGQALVKIHSDALETLRLQMESAAVQAENANRELARLQPLYAGGYTSQQSYEQAQDGAKSAALAYETAKTQYELQLSYTTVTAPISGVVETRNVEVHDQVSPSAPVCVISGGNQVQAEFGVTEKIMGHMQPGDTVTIQKNGTDYEGTVTEVGSMVNASTGLYDVKASIAQGSGLTSGARVKVTAVMDEARDVLTVPLDAVSYDNGEPFVYCYEEGTAKKVMIGTGIGDQESVEVTEGLTEDSQVITSWSNELADGQEVLPDEGGR